MWPSCIIWGFFLRGRTIGLLKNRTTALLREVGTWKWDDLLPRNFYPLCTLLDILAIDINNIQHRFAIYKTNSKHPVCKYSIYVLLLNLKTRWEMEKKFNLAAEWILKSIFLWKDETSGLMPKFECLHRRKSQRYPGAQPLHSLRYRHYLKKRNRFEERALRNISLECSKPMYFCKCLD